MHFPCSSIACFALSQQQQPTQLHTSPLFASVHTLPDMADIAVETPASKYDSMIGWLKSNGATVNENLCFRPSSRGGGYGAFVTNDVTKDEILVTIPRKVCVTLDDVRNDPESGEVFELLMKEAGPGGNTVALAGIIAKERLIACYSCRPFRSQGSGSHPVKGRL